MVTAEHKRDMARVASIESRRQPSETDAGYDAAVQDAAYIGKTARDVQNKPTVRRTRVHGGCAEMSGGVYFDPVPCHPTEPLRVVPLYTPYDPEYHHNRKSSEVPCPSANVEEPELSEAALDGLRQQWEVILSSQELPADLPRSRRVVFSSARMTFEESRRPAGEALDDEPTEVVKLRPTLMKNGEVDESAVLRELAKTLDDGELLGLIFQAAGHSNAEILRHQKRLEGEDRAEATRKAWAAGMSIGNRAPITALRSLARKLKNVRVLLAAEPRDNKSTDAVKTYFVAEPREALRMPRWKCPTHLFDAVQEVLAPRMNRFLEKASCYDQPRRTSAPRKQPPVFTIYVPAKYLASARLSLCVF